MFLLPVIILLVLKHPLSDINMAISMLTVDLGVCTPHFYFQPLWDLGVSNFYFQPMRLRGITSRQDIVEFCIFDQAGRLYLLVAVVALFAINVVIAMVGFKLPPCCLFSVYLIWLLFFHFSSYFCLINDFYISFLFLCCLLSSFVLYL